MNHDSFGHLLATRTLCLLLDDGETESEPVGFIDLSMPQRIPAEGDLHEHWMVSVRFRECELAGRTSKIYGEDAFQAIYLALAYAGAMTKTLPHANKINYVAIGDAGFPPLPTIDPGAIQNGQS